MQAMASAICPDRPFAYSARVLQFPVVPAAVDCLRLLCLGPSALGKNDPFVLG